MQAPGCKTGPPDLSVDHRRGPAAAEAFHDLLSDRRPKIWGSGVRDLGVHRWTPTPEFSDGREPRRKNGLWASGPQTAPRLSERSRFYRVRPHGRVAGLSHRRTAHPSQGRAVERFRYRYSGLSVVMMRVWFPWTTCR